MRPGLHRPKWLAIRESLRLFTHSQLESMTLQHVLASPEKHRNRHGVRCTRTNCDPRKCPGAYSGDFGPLGSSAMTVLPAATPAPSFASLATIPLTEIDAPTVGINIAVRPPSRSEKNKFHCGVCTKFFASSKKLQSVSIHDNSIVSDTDASLIAYAN
jgi:hypothetical protein